MSAPIMRLDFASTRRRVGSGAIVLLDLLLGSSGPSSDTAVT